VYSQFLASWIKRQLNQAPADGQSLYHWEHGKVEVEMTTPVNCEMPLSMHLAHSFNHQRLESRVNDSMAQL